MAPVAHVCTQPVTLAHATEPEQAELLAKGMGMLTSNIGEAGGYLTVMPDAPAPDLQFHFAPTWFISDGAGNPTDSEGFTIMPSLVGTKSVGEITLASANPEDAPLINPNALAEAQDLEILVEGVKIARKIMSSPALDDFRGEERFPGVDVQTDDAPAGNWPAGAFVQAARLSARSGRTASGAQAAVSAVTKSKRNFSAWALFVNG